MPVPTKTFTAAAAAFLMIAGPAFAEAKVHLTAAEQATVTDACRVGMPLIPVASDFGHETGEYALPLSEADGAVHSALIISETALRDIPECSAEIDAIAEREGESETSIS